MGSFANLGALAGAASGWAEGGKQEDAAKQHKLDQEREERLQQMQYDRQMERDKAGYSHEDSMKQADYAHGDTLQAGKEAFETSEREGRQEFDAEQNRLDREGNVELEGAKTQADKTKSREKFQKGRTPDKETQNADGTWSTVPGVPTVYNPTNKRIYLQNNDLGWVAEGQKLNQVRLPKNRASEEKKLYDHPTSKNMALFEEHFHYLPKEVMGAHERYLDSNPD